MSHVMILSMLVFFGLTVPIAISIGLAAMGGVAIAGLPWLVIAQQMPRWTNFRWPPSRSLSWPVI